MTQLILSVGRYTSNPYCFEKLDIRVYCVEELCYVLKENAFLIDRDIMSKKLADWLDEECGASDLARQLYPLINQKGAVSTFVAVIMEYVGLYKKDTIAEVERMIRSGANLSDIEKRKAKIDYYVNSKRYMEAMAQYDRLLQEISPGESIINAAIYHNYGVALCGLFLFEQAAKYFKKAYEISGYDEYMDDCLAAVRMSMNDETYVSYMAEKPEQYERSLVLERKINDILDEWEQSLDYKKLVDLEDWKDRSENAIYYEELELLICGLKEKYRKHVG